MVMLPSTSEILERGYVDIRMWIAGMLQKHRLIVEYEQTPFGKIPYLVIDRQVPEAELLRVANAVQLPVKASNARVFPLGKAPADFTAL